MGFKTIYECFEQLSVEHGYDEDIGSFFKIESESFSELVILLNQNGYGINPARLMGNEQGSNNDHLDGFLIFSEDYINDEQGYWETQQDA